MIRQKIYEVYGLPKTFYSHTMYGKNEKDIRQQIREMYKVNRVPNNVVIITKEK